MKNLALHIGMHKTGSTSIQVHFTRQPNYGAWHYSRHGKPSYQYKQGHHLIAWKYMPDIKQCGLLHQTEAEVFALNISEMAVNLNDKDSDIILSSEEFSALPPHEFKQLCEDLIRHTSFNLNIIVYLRSFLDWYDSAYTTSVIHSGYTNSFSHFIRNNRISHLADALEALDKSIPIYAVKYDSSTSSVESFKKVLDCISSSSPAQRFNFIDSVIRYPAEDNLNTSYSRAKAMKVRRLLISGSSLEHALSVTDLSDEEENEAETKFYYYSESDISYVLSIQEEFDSRISRL